MADENDFELSLTSFGSGSIRFKDTPREGLSRYQANFMVSSETTVGVITISNGTPQGEELDEQTDNARRAVEDEAARRIPEILRLLADQIDLNIAAYDTNAAARRLTHAEPADEALTSPADS